MVAAREGKQAARAPRPSHYRMGRSALEEEVVDVACGCGRDVANSRR